MRGCASVFINSKLPQLCYYYRYHYHCHHHHIIGVNVIVVIFIVVIFIVVIFIVVIFIDNVILTLIAVVIAIGIVLSVIIVIVIIIALLISLNMFRCFYAKQSLRVVHRRTGVLHLWVNPLNKTSSTALTKRLLSLNLFPKPVLLYLRTNFNAQHKTRNKDTE